MDLLWPLDIFMEQLCLCLVCPSFWTQAYQTISGQPYWKCKTNFWMQFYRWTTRTVEGKFRIGKGRRDDGTTDV